MKKYSPYIAILVAVFVVFLGMRNPWLDKTPGPKRKGRAAVSNLISKNLSVSVEKSCKDKDNSAPPAILLTTPLSSIPTCTTSPAKIDAEFITPHPCLSLHSGRAPPSTHS